MPLPNTVEVTLDTAYRRRFPLILPARYKSPPGKTTITLGASRRHAKFSFAALVFDRPESFFNVVVTPAGITAPMTTTIARSTNTEFWLRSTVRITVPRTPYHCGAALLLRTIDGRVRSRNVAALMAPCRMHPGHEREPSCPGLPNRSIGSMTVIAVLFAVRPYR